MTSRGIDLMVQRAVDPGGDRGAQARFQATDLAARQPSGVEARAALQIEAETQALDLVAADRQHQGPVWPVIDRAAGFGFEGVAEPRPAPERFQGERQQRVGAGLVLGGRGQHAGGGEARAGPDRLALQHRHGAARPGEPPRDREPDQAAADDGDVGPAPAGSRARRARRGCGGDRSVKWGGRGARASPRIAVAGIGPGASVRSCGLPFRAAAVQSLRRYEPDQVRRISAPQVLTDVPAVSQPLAGDLPGTRRDLVVRAAAVNPAAGRPSAPDGHSPDLSHRSDTKPDEIRPPTPAVARRAPALHGSSATPAPMARAGTGRVRTFVVVCTIGFLSATAFQKLRERTACPHSAAPIAAPQPRRARGVRPGRRRSAGRPQRPFLRERPDGRPRSADDGGYRREFLRLLGRGCRPDRDPGRPGDFNRVWNTANGTVRVAPIRIAVMQVGSITVRDVEAVVIPRGRLATSLLGMSFLKRLRDFSVSGGTMTLRG